MTLYSVQSQTEFKIKVISFETFLECSFPTAVLTITEFYQLETNRIKSTHGAVCLRSYALYKMTVCIYNKELKLSKKEFLNYLKNNLTLRKTQRFFGL